MRILWYVYGKLSVWSNFRQIPDLPACKSIVGRRADHAEIAPAFTGQFGDNINARNLKAALEELGFSQVYEVALGADIGAIAEAHHYVEKVTTGELPFLLTSCCPSWAMLTKKYFPGYDR